MKNQHRKSFVAFAVLAVLAALFVTNHLRSNPANVVAKEPAPGREQIRDQKSADGPVAPRNADGQVRARAADRPSSGASPRESRSDDRAGDGLTERAGRESSAGEPRTQDEGIDAAPPRLRNVVPDLPEEDPDTSQQGVDGPVKSAPAKSARANSARVKRPDVKDDPPPLPAQSLPEPFEPGPDPVLGGDPFPGTGPGGAEPRLDPTLGGDGIRQPGSADPATP